MAYCERGTMTAFWNVPYYGQVGEGANEHGSDCGPTCAAMIIAWNGITPPSIDVLFNEVSSGNGYTSYGDIGAILSHHGIKAEYDAGISTQELFTILSGGVPVITLIRYGALETIRPNTFKGSHFVVIIGMDLDTIYINDPLNTPTIGKCIAVPMKMFETAWSTVGDNNPQRSLMIPAKGTGIPVPTPTIIKIVTPRDWNGCNVRKIPGLLTEANKLYGIKFGAKINIYEINSDNWGKISPTRDEWISLDYTVNA
jgi:hypothetical protein